MVCLNFTLSAQVFIFFCHFAVNRAHFPDQLAVARWLRLNVTFMYNKKTLCKVKFNAQSCLFIQFHTALCFHSLLRHLIYIWVSRLPFGGWRYKLAAGSIPQFFSKLGAIVFFAAFFLKRKRVSLRTPSYSCVLYSITYQEPSISASIWSLWELSGLKTRSTAQFVSCCSVSSVSPPVMP